MQSARSFVQTEPLILGHVTWAQRLVANWTQIRIIVYNYENEPMQVKRKFTYRWEFLLTATFFSLKLWLLNTETLDSRRLCNKNTTQYLHEVLHKQVLIYTSSAYHQEARRTTANTFQKAHLRPAASLFTCMLMRIYLQNDMLVQRRKRVEIRRSTLQL